MLSIGKLRVGAEAYYLSGVAQSLAAYYTGEGEAAGRWMGGGAARLGLSGDVDDADLSAVLAGLRPGTGGLTPNGDTARPQKNRTPGFDLTFKPPKSVSVLYGVTDDPRVQGAIIEAGERALVATLGWLERDAVRVRRGSNNLARWRKKATKATEQGDAPPARPGTVERPTTGVVAAVFRHRTSRAGDPLLHWHTLVANLAEGADGRWSAIVHPHLFRAKRAAGEVFQTALRAELTNSLGLEWQPGRHVPEIAGVPQRICRLFSRRRAAIEEYLAEHGQSASQAEQTAAALATRRSKRELEGIRFDEEWKQRSVEAGWGPDQVDELLAAVGPRTGQPVSYDDVWRLVDDSGVEQVVDADRWAACLADDLTQDTNTFTRRDVTQAVAARLGAGAAVATIERVVDRVLASQETVAVSGLRDEDHDRYTSAGLLAVEQRFLARLHKAAHRTPVNTSTIDQVLAERPSIGVDQADAVRRLLRTGRPVSVLIGPAGTGKTYTMDAIRDGLETAGHTVLGAAPSARAALELTAHTGIDSRTLARWRYQLDTGNHPFGKTTVLVIDEAGMAGLRDLDVITGAVLDAGGRIILVGDHRQLPEISAGGGFAAAALDTPPDAVAELTINRRQHQQWERDALTELREGHVATAYTAYKDHGRVIVTADPDRMIDEAVDRWFTARDGGDHAILLASTNELLDRLNQRAQAERITRGELHADQRLVFGSRHFHPGEQIVVRKNRLVLDDDGRRLRIANGQTGRVDGVNKRGWLIVTFDGSGRSVALKPDYAAHHIDLGYALTSHRAQGGTWDAGISVGTAGVYREAGYLNLSRARKYNLLVVDEAEDRDLEIVAHDREHPGLAPAVPVAGEVTDVDVELVGVLSQSRAKTMASQVDPLAAPVQHAATHPTPVLDARARYCRQIERLADETVGVDMRGLLETLARAEHTAHHLAGDVIVRALDRGNVGRVLGWDDTAGRVDVEFRSPTTGSLHTRDFHWSNVEILGQPPVRRLNAAAAATVNLWRTKVAERRGRWTSILARHGVDVDEADICDRAARRRIDRETARLTSARPGWLTALTGTAPDDPVGRQVWTDLVADIAAWRSRHDLPASVGGLGLDRRQPDEQVGALLSRFAATRRWIAERDLGPVAAPTRALPAASDRARELDDLFNEAPLADGTDPETRRTWVLAHWPQIVERDELAHHTDDPAGVAIDTLFDLITATLEPLDSPEQRTIANLEADQRPSLAIRAQLDAATALAVDPDVDPATRASLDSHRRQLLTHLRQTELAEQLEGPVDPTPIQDRLDTLLWETVTRRPTWATTLLQSHLQLPSAQLRQLVADVAVYRDRWDISSDDPYGPEPRDPEPRQQWRQLTDRPARETQPPALDGLDVS